MKITIQELQSQIRRGPGVVIGPDISTSSSREADCLTYLKGAFPFPEIDATISTYLDYSDVILAKSEAGEVQLRTEVESFFKNVAFANPQLPTVVKPNWTVVVSLCSDDFFKTKLADFLYAVPTKWSLTTIAEPGIALPLTTVPYYALMGDLRDNREACSLAISRSQFLRRQRVWSRVLSSLPHILKSDPLIFLGTGSIVNRVCEFINELLRLEPQVPKRLIFLENDPTPKNAVFKNLIGTACEVEIADCTLTDLGNLLSRESLAIKFVPLFTDNTKALVDPKAFEEIEDQVAYVPRREEIKANRAERNRLLDSLFRPTQLDWAPYAFAMQFRRDICSALNDRIKKSFSSKNTESRVVQIRGEAGIGKTVICRTVAFDLAQENFLSLWIKRSYGELSGSRFDSVVQTLNEGIRRTGTDVVFFLDDPIGSRVTLNEVVTALNSAKFRWVVVVSTRKTDETLLTRDGVAGSVSPESTLTVPAEFTNHELPHLPEYLVSLGVAPSIEEAKNMMIPEGMKHSKDVLCSLWYLLPQTHAAIEDSLVGEYRRLGEAEEFVRQFAEAAGDTKSIAKAAYEFVTATSGFDNTPLPVEVLVSALGISYSEWNKQCKNQKPLWGLLYDEEYPSAETYAYRTRNYVVTDVLLRALNQGTAGHTGEHRCLKRLLAACTSTTPQYKTFLWDILVNRRSLIEKRFSYIQAMELYDAGLKAFPKPIGVVQHQREIVKRHLGGDAQEVYDELKKLIARSHDRGIADQDSPDNLHTSAAAALNQLVKEDRVDPVSAGESVFEHVSAALAIDQFSLHSHHVHAHSLLSIASHLRNSNRTAFMANLERAARITGRALLMVQQTSVAAQATYSMAESVQMFNELKDEILFAHPNIDKAQLEAKDLFKKTGDQTGLAFVARVLLTKATDTKKGHSFKKVEEYLCDCFKLVADDGKLPCEELVLCRIELVANWQLNQNKGPICWERFEGDLLQIVRTPHFAPDVIWTFYLAVAEYNQGKFNEAEGRFQWLRNRNLPSQNRHRIRCFYLGDKSTPKIFEGKVTRGSHVRFIYSGELGTDVRVDRDEFEERPDEVKHFKIGFSFYGPLAVDRNS